MDSIFTRSTPGVRARPPSPVGPSQYRSRVVSRPYLRLVLRVMQFIHSDKRTATLGHALQRWHLLPPDSTPPAPTGCDSPPPALRLPCL
ncbi:hypothetical protein C8Q80DRAFT_73207 [Daedaleopsis nitida]|nr:hypothetical protein C8Q80DRAFT_73207 [Daedaleopsis nitida]